MDQQYSDVPDGYKVLPAAPPPAYSDIPEGYKVLGPTRQQSSAALDQVTRPQAPAPAPPSSVAPLDLQSTLPPPKGLVKPGNINLNNRPIIQNDDGTHSSEYSTSFGTDQGEVLVPTIVNGRFLTPDGKKPLPGSQAEKELFGYKDKSGVFHKGTAQKYYEKTGQHMGIFDNPENADAYAENAHNRRLSTSLSPQTTLGKEGPIQRPRSVAESLVTGQQERAVGGPPLKIQPPSGSLQNPHPEQVVSTAQPNASLAAPAQPPKVTPTPIDVLDPAWTARQQVPAAQRDQIPTMGEEVLGAPGYPVLAKGVQEVYGRGNAPGQVTQGAADILKGATAVATPLMIATGLAEPEISALALGGATAGGAGAKKLAQIVHASPEVQDLAEQAGQIAGGFAGGAAFEGLKHLASPENALTDLLWKRGYIQDNNGHPIYVTSQAEARAVAKEILKQNPAGVVESLRRKGQFTRAAADVNARETGVPGREQAQLPAYSDIPKGYTVIPPEAPKPAAPIGATEPETGRPVLQQSPRPEVNQAAATAEHPVIKDALAKIVNPIEGAKIAGSRPEKEPERRDEKIEEEGQSPRTVRDYSGYRIAVDSPAARDQVVAALKQNFEVHGEQDHFAQGDPDHAFHAHTLNVREPGSPVSHEVQILPKEVAETAEANHPLYEKAREGDKAATQELRQRNEENWNKFQARQEATGALQEPSTAGVFQRPQEEDGISGGRRGRVEPGEQGQRPAAARAEAPGQEKEEAGISAARAGGKPDVGVDFDGTLFTENPDGSIGQPIPERIASLKQMIAEGKNVIIESRRVKGRPEEITKIQDALVAAGLPRLPVTDEKVAPVLIDDSAHNVATNANTPLPQVAARQPGQAPIPPGRYGPPKTGGFEVVAEEPAGVESVGETPRLGNASPAVSGPVAGHASLPFGERTAPLKAQGMTRDQVMAEDARLTKASGESILNNAKRGDVFISPSAGIHGWVFDGKKFMMVSGESPGWGELSINDHGMPDPMEAGRWRSATPTERAEIVAANKGRAVSQEVGLSEPTQVQEAGKPVAKVPAEGAKETVPAPQGGGGIGSDQPTKYKFGNTQAPIAVGSEAHAAIESARARISDSDLAGKGKDIGDGGNHVTVRYGIQGEDTEGIKKFLSQQKRTTSLRQQIKDLEKETSKPTAYVQDSKRNANERQERSRKIDQLSNARAELREIEQAHKYELAKTLTPEKPVSEEGKNFEGRYVRASLEPVKTAWMEKWPPREGDDPDEHWKWMVKNVGDTADKPAGFSKGHLFIKVPDDGEVYIPNTPFAIDHALKATSKFESSTPGEALPKPRKPGQAPVPPKDIQAIKDRIAALEAKQTPKAPRPPAREGTTYQVHAAEVADRLRKSADAMDKHIDHARRPMEQNPTPKRMAEYRSRLIEADDMERTQKAMRALADAHEAGTVSRDLAGLRSRDEIARLVHKGLDTSKGGYYDRIPRQDYYDKSPAGKQLQEMIEGAKSPEATAAKLAKEKASKISQLEADVQFRPLPGYFPTPKAVAERLVKSADIRSGMSVLEPSAGKGNIAEAIVQAAPEAKLSVVEQSPKLQEILKLKDFNLVDSDFLEHDNHYDRIVMNPPFEKNADIDHVRHAYDLLKPGGRLVAVMSPHAEFANDKTSADFRNWLDDRGGTSEKLPESSFKESGTGVASRMVTIDKPAEKPVAAEAKPAAPPGAPKPVAGVEKVSKAEATFDADVRKRAAKLRATVAEMETRLKSPAGTFQDSSQNAAARDQRRANEQSLSEAKEELEKIEEAHPHEVKPLDLGKLPDRETNKHAFQREYFTQSLQPVLDAWKSHLGDKFANAAKNGMKGTNRPEQFPERQVLVNVPGDGHFKVNNDPKVLTSVIKGAVRGFAKPGPDASILAAKPPKPWRMPAVNEASKWNYLDRMADEAVDAATQQEKDVALETIENILGFTPMTAVPKAGTLIEYRGQQFYTNGVQSKHRQMVNIVPADTPGLKKYVEAGQTGLTTAEGAVMADRIRDAEEPASLYLLKPIEKSDSLSSSIQPMRTTEGGIKLGADVKSLGKILGSSLYKGQASGVITKELVQNAMDAIRSSPTKTVHVDVDTKNQSVTVKDTGPGMTREELETVFTDLGSSGKRDLAEASGGFGLAKAAPLMMSKRLLVTTVVSEDGKKIEHSFESTPDEMLGKGVQVETREVPASTPTGTEVEAHLSGDIYQATAYLSSSRMSLNAPGKLTYSVDGREMRDQARSIGKEPKATHAIPGAKVDLFVSDEKDSIARMLNVLNVEVHNNGIYQFTHSIWNNAAGLRGMPVRVAVDVHATVPEGDPEYPFMANREALRNEASNALNEFVSDEIIKPALNAQQGQISELYHSLPTFADSDIPLFDSGGRLTPKELEQMQNDPALLAIAGKIADLTGRAIERVSGSESFPVPFGKNIKRVGIVLSDKIHGVFITDPKNPHDSTVFINPFGLVNNNPYNAGSLVWHTIKHELIHDVVKGHNEQFTSTEANMSRALGKLELYALRELSEVYEDPTNDQRIRPDLDRAIQLYEKSRGRPEVTPDIFGGESLSRGGRSGPIGEGGNAGSLQPSGAGTVSTRVSEKPESLISGESGSFTPAQLHPARIRQSWDKLVDDFISGKLKIGDKYYEVAKHDPVVAHSLHLIDNKPMDMKRHAEANLKNVLSGLNDDQVRLAAMMVDSDSRDYLEANKPDEYQQALSDPKVMDAVKKFKPFQEELTKDRQALGWPVRRSMESVEQPDGTFKVVDRDGNEQGDFKTAGKAAKFIQDNADVEPHLKRTYPEHSRSPLPAETGAGDYTGSFPHEKGLRPPKMDKKAREMSAEYHYQHGRKDFSGYTESYKQTKTAIAKQELFDDFTKNATPWTAGTAQPSKIEYNGKTYYRPDLVAKAKEGGTTLPAYEIYDPSRGEKFLIANPSEGWATLTTGKPGITANSRFLGPKQVVDAMENYDTSRGGEAGKLRKFFQEQIVGLFGPMVHVNNILRRVGQTAGLGTFDPRSWPSIARVIASPELRARVLSGVDDATIAMLSREGAWVDWGDIGNLNRYIGGNLNPATWIRAFGKGVLFDPKFAGGWGGLDQKARVIIADYFKDHFPEMTDQQVAAAVNDGLGNYNRANWTERQRMLAKFVLFPGWDTASVKWFLRKPFKVGVAGALVTLAVNLALRALGKNKGDDSMDLFYIHYGDRKLSSGLISDNMGNHLMAPVLGALQAKLRDEDVGAGIAEGTMKGTSALAGTLAGPVIEMVADEVYNRKYAGGAAELVTPEDKYTPGTWAPNVELEKRIAFAALKGAPALNRFIDPQGHWDWAQGLGGGVLGVTNYKYGAEERFKANLAKAAVYGQTLNQLTQHGSKAAAEFVSDSTKATYLMFHDDLEQIGRNLKELDAQIERVRGSDLPAAERQKAIEDLKDNRNELLKAADGLNDALNEAKAQAKKNAADYWRQSVQVQ